MTDRRPLGDILQEIGRVTQEDVDLALAHQASHGGYFGEALVALGVVRQEELDWSLASQFDLPYVYPDAGSVDPEAAFLVSPDWALRHMALPLTRTGNRLILVVDSPLNTDAAAELAGRTGLEVELALASTRAIRAVIREVYAAATGRREGLASGEAISLSELFEGAERAGAERWGISVREERAIGWYEWATGSRRYRLQAGWEKALNAGLSPSLLERLPRRGEASWIASFQNPGEGPVMLDVRGLATDEGRELLFARRAPSESEHILPSVPQELLDELRLVLEQSRTVLAIRSHSGDMGRDLLPHLPGLLLPTGHRSVHLSGSEGLAEPTGVLTLPLALAGRVGELRLSDLKEFHFDAVTVELPPDRAEDWDEIQGLADDVFVLMAGQDEGTAGLPPSGVNWLLELSMGDEGAWKWSLEPVEG
jgi:hypothetical protein